MELFPLLALSLVDSLSAGTLVIPLVLLITWGRMHAVHYGTYLSTIAVAYFGIGIALFFGMRWIFDLIGSIGATTWFAWVSLALGIALLAFGVLSPNPKRRPIEEIVAKRCDGMGTTSVLAMIGLAVGAAVVEAATMLPYLAAVGIIQSMDVSFLMQLLILAIYCCVMIGPAVLIGFLCNQWGDTLFSRLTHIIPRLEYEAKVTILWIAAFVGLYMTANAVNQLGLLNYT